MPRKRTTAPGTWTSPVTPALVARASRRIGSVHAGGGFVYWSESRPEEEGRQAIVRAGPDGRTQDVLPQPFSARSRVHEYGGGEFLLSGETIFFVNDRDQQIYSLAPDRAPHRVTNEPRTRFADMAHDRRRGRLIAVAETHPAGSTRGAHALPRNRLAAIGLRGAEGRLLRVEEGHDFYASPRLSDDGSSLAFLAWDLPDMPWDGAALHVATLGESGRIARTVRVAGGDGSSVFQPEWGPDGSLYFTWDRTGWGGLYRWAGSRPRRVHGAAGAELWRAQWVFGMRCFALHSDGRFAAASLASGAPQLEVGRLAGGRTKSVRTLRTGAARIDDPAAAADGFVALASPPLSAPAVMRVQRTRLQAIAAPSPPPVDARYISRGEVLAFRNARRQTVFGIYYAPTNPHCRSPKGVAPPALVLAHGGPTSMSDPSFKPRVQFYTSRGFAVCDVNYAGSTGFGRAYRERLYGQWGIADVADCAAAARHLGAAKLADGGKIAIAGGSAGGYTTLMALATTDAFAAGSSHYGISDLALLLAHTHKFESGYLHRLLGTTPARWKEVFAARSPVNLVDRISAPVILFQGLDDKVVPPEQSRLMADRLRRRGIEVGYHEFAGEGHGFRKAETMIAVLEAELAFLRRALALDGAQPRPTPRSR